MTLLSCLPRKGAPPAPHRAPPARFSSFGIGFAEGIQPTCRGTAIWISVCSTCLVIGFQVDFTTRFTTRFATSLATWHTFLRAWLFPHRYWNRGPAHALLVGLLITGLLGGAGIRQAAGAPEGKGAASPGSPGEAGVGEGGRSKPAIRMLEQTLALGGVAPRDSLGAAGSWAEIRAAITAEFKPTAALITSDSKPQAVVKQLVSPGPMRSAPPTLATAAEEPTGELDPVGQADAARKAYERPVNVRTVELLAVIEADGRLSTISVLIPSGNSNFDDMAIAAVRHGFSLRDRAAPDRSEYPQGSRLNVRLRVSAGRAVALPRIVPLRERPQQNLRLPSRGLIATGSTQFDETTGHVATDPMFANRLSTQIELLSVTPAPPPAPPPATAPAN